MPNVLVPAQSGDFTDSTTWNLCDPTAQLDSQNGHNPLSTSPSDSDAFQPGAVGDAVGIMLKISQFQAGQSGTMDVILRNHTDSVDVATVTVNVADIFNSVTASNANQGWCHFRFASPVTLVAGKDYKIRLTISTSSQGPWFFRGPNSGTDWTRQLVMSDNVAPGSGDKLLICGQFTAPGTKTDIEVTMDNTASTTFGAVLSSTNPCGMSISKFGILKYSTAGSLNLLLRIRGYLHIYADGQFIMGDSVDPIDPTSTATLEFNESSGDASNPDTGVFIRSGGKFITEGEELTHWKAKLTANASASATSLTTDVSTGWKSGQLVAIGGTSRSYGDTEVKALSGDASGTTLPIAATSAAHSGTSPTQAEVAVVNRNVVIKGIDSTHPGTIIITANDGDWGRIKMRWTWCYWFAGNSNGINNQCNTGGPNSGLDIQFCSFTQPSVNRESRIRVSAGSGTNIFSRNLMYCDPDVVAWFMNLGNSIPFMTLEDNLFMGTSCQMGNVFYGVAGTVTVVKNNTMVGIRGDFSPLVLSQQGRTGTLEADGNIVHSSGNSFLIDHNYYAPWQVFGEFIAWRNNTHGMLMQGTCDGIDIARLEAWGNNGAGLCANAGAWGRVIIREVDMGSDTTFSQSRGFLPNNSQSRYSLRIMGGKMGHAAGIRTEHGTADIGCVGDFQYLDIRCSNVSLESTTKIESMSFQKTRSNTAIRFDRYGQVDGDYREYRPYVVTTRDTVISNVSPVSRRVKPLDALIKVETRVKQVAVANGNSVTASVAVRKSETADAGGADYNGAQPRFILKANPAIGIPDDVVLDTMTGGLGSWVTLGGVAGPVTDDGVLEFVVDCDGSAGWINITDWTAS